MPHTKTPPPKPDPPGDHPGRKNDADLTVRLPSDLKNRIAELGEITGRSMASYVVAALRYCLPIWERQADRVRAAGKGETHDLP